MVCMHWCGWIPGIPYKTSRSWISWVENNNHLNRSPPSNWDSIFFNHHLNRFIFRTRDIHYGFTSCTGEYNAFEPSLTWTLCHLTVFHHHSPILEIPVDFWLWSICYRLCPRYPSKHSQHLQLPFSTSTYWTIRWWIYTWTTWPQQNNRHHNYHRATWKRPLHTSLICTPTSTPPQATTSTRQAPSNK